MYCLLNNYVTPPTHAHTHTHPTPTHTNPHTLSHTHRQLDLREPHTCTGDGSCRNVLIDLNQTCGGGGPASGPQLKCLDINPVRPEQIAVGALDPFVRVYDTRILSLQRMAQSASSTHGDPACLAHFAPGHISNPAIRKKRELSGLASTYVEYSQDGRELLVNLSGEHVYLFDTTLFTESLKYDFDKADSDSVPIVRPHHYATTVPSMSCHVTTSAGHVTSRQQDGDIDVSIELQLLKDKALDLTKAKHYTQAIDTLSHAISLCPSWYELYYLRATAFYTRKWSVYNYYRIASNFCMMEMFVL